jgi:hypothetical protein
VLIDFLYQNNKGNIFCDEFDVLSEQHF